MYTLTHTHTHTHTQLLSYLAYMAQSTHWGRVSDPLSKQTSVLVDPKPLAVHVISRRAHESSEAESHSQEKQQLANYRLY